MHNFSFATATQIRFGRGASSQLGSASASFGNRAILITGASTSRYQWVFECLKKHNVDFLHFQQASEPSLKQLNDFALEARKFEADLVIAVGGGAVIDMAKAISALIPEKGPILDYFEIVGKNLPLESDPLPFIAVPTTAGTGAEVTKNSVITIDSHNRKVSLRSDKMFANIAIVDPALTDDTPKLITLQSGLDAITQVIEPYISSKNNSLTDAIAKPAIGMGLNALISLMKSETAAARDELSYVSLCGGLVLANSGLGAVHGLAGVIGGETGIAHGAICGLLLPIVLTENMQHSKEPYQTRIKYVRSQIAQALHSDEETAFTALSKFIQSNGLTSEKQFGIEYSMFENIARQSLESSSMKGNPVALNENQLIKIIKTV